MLHYGHLKHLEEAKKYGDRLVVTITADKFIRKGPGRPYFDERRRKEMLESLSIIDKVIIVESSTALPAIDEIRPDFYVKGSDYKNLDEDVTGEILNEKAAVESYGGKLVFTETEMFSSSKLINGFADRWTDDQRTQIEAIKDCGGFKCIKAAIDSLEPLRVLVVGEPITDIYRFVRAEGISSKSPSISCRFEREEVYEGGSTAIANHLGSFCDVELVPMDKEHRKIRYISGRQRIFEVTEIDESYRPWKAEWPERDVIVAADFGHGMFMGGELDGRKEFVGLNVQANSSNYGFNVYSKHRRFDYLCLDEREARLALHDRYSEPLTVARNIAADTKRLCGFTRGPNGAYLINGAQTYFSPAFSDRVVDATGAGDAYFAITTVLLGSGCNPVLVTFIGNVFAGLKTKIIGNKEAVSKASLLKACEAILK